jgi:hypothetical protein
MKVIKTSLLFIRMLTVIVFILVSACDEVIVESTGPPLPRYPAQRKDKKPRTPVPLGCIRGYFGDSYITFDQHIEKVQPIDSFSNCFFYGNCYEGRGQINLIRCDSSFVLAMFINGYALDSLPTTLPVPPEYGGYAEIQFSPWPGFNMGSPGHYLMNDFYGNGVLITDKTDDILTGTFEGTMRSSTGNTLLVKDGEFKIKIFRKFMPCAPDSEK